MEQKKDGSYADRWLEKRNQSTKDATEDIEFLNMLAEISRGQQ